MRNDENDSLSLEMAESRWLLDLARALVGASAAEDLMQEAWLERLKKPEEARHPRALMATILRRLAGRRGRELRAREAREAEAAERRRELVIDAADRGRRMALLWREVEELDHETRSLIVLRYLDGLEPQHIARKLGLTPNAARVRIHRALDEVRDRLDRRHGGRREDWLRALAPLVLASGPLVPSAGLGAAAKVTKIGIAMTIQKKVLIAAGALLLIGGTAFVWSDFREREHDPLPTAPEQAQREEALPRRDQSAAETDLATTVATTTAAVEIDENDPELLAARALEAAIGSTLRDLIAGPRLIGGRVLDQARRPVAGAKVAWRRPDGATTTTTTDKQGRFDIMDGGKPAAGLSRRGLLIARDAKLGVASRSIVVDEHVRCDRLEAELVLAPGAEVLVNVVDSEGKPAPDAEIEISAPGALPSERGKTDAAGRFQARTISPGAIRISAVRGAEAAELYFAATSSGENDLTLRLQTAPAFELQVLGPDDRPIEDATLRFQRVVDDDAATPISGSWPGTDENGKVTIEGMLDPASLLVNASADGFRPSGDLDLEEVLDQGRAVIRLEAARRLTWKLREGEVPTPEDGETIKLRPEKLGLEESGVEDLPLPKNALGAVPGLLDRRGPRASIVAGQLVIEGATETEALIAVTTRGDLARVWTSGEGERGEVVFGRPRSISIRVMEAAVGAANVGLQLRDLGGTPIRPTAVTDRDGRARFEGIVGGSLDLFVGRSGAMREHAYRAATVNLDEDSKEIEIQLEKGQRVTAAISLDGRPGLPAHYELRLADAQILAIEERAGEGLLLIDYRPMREVAERELRIEVHGRLPASAMVRAEGHQEVRLALLQAPRLRLHILLPRDHRVTPELLIFDPQRADWIVAAEDDLRAAPGEDELRLEVTGLATGRYRLQDSSSQIWSDEVELSGPGSEAEIILDLREVATVTGRVLVPEGMSLDDVRVSTRGPGVTGRESWRLFGLPLDQDGRFRLRINGAEGLEIVARHPLLLEASVTPKHDGEDVLIVLEPGPSVTAVLPEDISPMSRLRVFRVGERKSPLLFVSLQDAAGRLQVGSLRPGGYDFVFDCPPYAPLEVINVRVSEDGADLGKIAFDLGQTLIIELKLPQGAKIPDLYVSARRLDAGGAVRFKNAFNENPIKLAGLLPGRYSIEIGSMPSSGDERSFEIEVRAGENPVLSYP